MQLAKQNLCILRQTSLHDYWVYFPPEESVEQFIVEPLAQTAKSLVKIVNFLTM